MFFVLKKKKNEGKKTLTSLVLLRTAQATNDVLALVQMKTLAFSLPQFNDAAKTAKEAFTQSYRALGIKQFYKHGCHRWAQIR